MESQKTSTHLSKKGISRLKMVVYSKIINDKPVVWYSPIKENNHTNQKIIDGMMERFKENYNINFYKVACFYDYLSSTELLEKRNL